MRFEIPFVLALLLGGAGCLTPTLPRRDQLPVPAKAPGRYSESLEIGTKKRTYILRVPRTYDGSQKIPLVVLLHGWTSNGSSAEGYTGFGSLADREGFALVSPDGLGDPRGWNAGFFDLGGERADDVGFIRDLLGRCQSELSIDPDRIYVVGYSNGGMLAHAVGSRLSDKVAAIAAVAGTLGLPGASGGTNTIPDPVAPISVIVVHGQQDEMVAYGSTGPGVLRGVGAFACAEWWASRLRAQKEAPVEEFPGITKNVWSKGTRNTEVDLISIRNGTHAWPGAMNDRLRGANFDGAAYIWRFFKAHPKSR